MKRIGFVAGALLAACVAQAAPIALNSDSAVETHMRNVYARMTFLTLDSGTGPVRTFDLPSSADTPDNSLGLTTGGIALSYADGRAIDVLFDSPVNFVSIRARFFVDVGLHTPFAGSLPFLVAYNSDIMTSANRIGLGPRDIANDSCLLSDALCFGAYDALNSVAPATSRPSESLVRRTAALPVEPSSTR